MGRMILGIAVAACVALAGTASAQVKGAGKSSITIVKVPAPAATTPTPKTAGSVSSKSVASVVGKPPTGGGSFALKLAKDVGDPTKPGFLDGEYVLDLESAGTPTGDIIGSPISAEYFITLTITLGKCTIHDLASVDPNHPMPMCGGAMQPPCALADQAGKCSATIYQVAGNALASAGLVANQPFGGRFRIRTNPDPTKCHTGDLLLNNGTLAPPDSLCKTGTLVGVGGVALGTTS